MSLLLFFPGAGGGQPDQHPPIAPPITVLVNGVDKTGFVRAVQNLRIEYTLGGRTVLTCEFVDRQANTQTAYRPTIDQPVSVIYNTTTVFTGTILSVEDRALGDPSIGVVVRISATSLWRAASQRLMSRALPAGYTLKQVVTDLQFNYLDDYGITLDPLMPNGPTMDALSFDYVTVEAGFQRLSDLTGWVYRLSPSNVVQWFQIGAQVVPITLSAANANVLGGVQWSQTRGRFVNRQFVRYGTSSVVLKTDTIIADGALQSWPLKHPGLLGVNGFIQSRGLVRVDGVDWPLGWYGIDATAWTYDPATNGLYTTVLYPAGTVIEFTYNVQFPLITYDENAASISTRGPWEDMVDAPDIFDKGEARTLATALLRRYSAVPRELRVRTRAGLFLPGDTVALNLPERTITPSDWLVTAVTMADEVDQALTTTLTLLEGTEAQSSWVDFWRSVLGGGTSSAGSSGTITGTIIPTQGSHFEDDVVARVGDDGIISAEVALRGNVASASYSGSALTLGRLASPLAWSIVGDQLNLSRGLYFVPMAERLSTRYAMALRQSATSPSDSAYFLVPHGGSGVLYLGGRESEFGTGYRVSLYSQDINNAGGIITAGAFAADGGLHERGRTTMIGDWDEVPFSAGMFTGSGGMTVTLTSTDQSRYRWMRVGSTVWIELTLKTFTIGGTLSDQVRVTLPSGLVTAAAEQWTVYHYVNNGTHGIGLCGCSGAGLSYLQFFIQPFATSWAASTDASEIRATITLNVA